MGHFVPKNMYLLVDSDSIEILYYAICIHNLVVNIYVPKSKSSVDDYYIRKECPIIRGKVCIVDPNWEQWTSTQAIVSTLLTSRSVTSCLIECSTAQLVHELYDKG